MVQTYIPSTIYLTVSWLALFVPPQSIAERLAMAMTIMLTLTAMFASERQVSPSGVVRAGYGVPARVSEASWLKATTTMGGSNISNKLRKNVLSESERAFRTCFQNVPRVSYVTYLDVWMLGCIFFVFMELVEFTLVLALLKVGQSVSSNCTARAFNYIGLVNATDVMIHGIRIGPPPSLIK